LQQDIKSAYENILQWVTHVSFIGYIFGYSMGLMENYSRNFETLIIQDTIFIGIFMITYALYMMKKISMETSVKILATFIVIDMLYPGIINPNNGDVELLERTIAIRMIIVFVVAFTTGRAFAIGVNISLLVLLILNAFLVEQSSLIEMLPTTLLCLGGMGAFSIVFENLIRKLLNSAIESQKKIQELSDYKQNIVRHVIHDLKIPVSVILNLSSNEEGAKLRDINYQVENVNKQLEKILDIERLEEPEIDLNLETASIKHIIQDAIKSVAILAHGKNITILEKYEANGNVLCDINLIQRLVMNLLSNAIKYSSANSCVTMIVRERGNSCVLQVEDKGRGISADHINNIFNKFYLIKDDNVTNTTSTGLGLAFCKLAAEAHNGTISVSSVEGEGSLFEVVLPYFTHISKPWDMPEESNDLTFSKKEDKILSSVSKKIAVVPIYNVSEIVQYVSVLDTLESKSVNCWRRQLMDAVYTGNQDYFNTLTAPFCD